MNNPKTGSCSISIHRPFAKASPQHSPMMIAIVCAILFAQTLAAQALTGAIEGRVLNPATGDYVLGARVSLEGTEQSVLTDATGHYYLGSIDPGPASIVITYPGLAAEKVTVNVTGGQRTRCDVSLQKAGDRPGEVVVLTPISVTASREMDANLLAINEQRHAPNIKNVIAADAFGDVSEGNLGEFLKRIPGLATIDAAGDVAEISMRGFDGIYTPITVGGMSTPNASPAANRVEGYFEQNSISNVSRIEVIKSPIPSMPANFLGGSINLIMKSAFERSKPQLTVRGTVQFTGDDHSWSKSPGPGTPETRKLRPGYDFTYVNPVSENFGFTISSMLSDQFGKLLGPVNTWEFAPAQGGSETAPYLRTIRTTEDSRQTRRGAHSANIDWRPWESLTLSFGARIGTFDLFTAPNRMTFNTGNNPVSHDANHTQGRNNAGSIVHQQIWTGKVIDTQQFTFSAKFQKDHWRADVSASTSESTLTYPDLQWGFFRGATTRLIPSLSPTLTYQNINGANMPEIQLRNGSGQAVDWKNLSNYQIMSVSSNQRDVTDLIDQLSINIRREFFWKGHSGAIQFGGSYQEQTRDRRTWTDTWNFVGADGVAGTADDNAAPFTDPINRGIDAKFNTPLDINWPDSRALYALYLERPHYFVLQQPGSYRSKVSGSDRTSESITAAYLQGEIRLFQNRVLLLGGVRFEKTEFEGTGQLRDRLAIYQRDASGELLRTPGGALIPITNDPLERAKLEYVERGQRSTGHYDDYFPSLNATIHLRDNLLLRLGYGRTMGRPDFTQIVARMDVNENADTGVGRINGRNSNLRPWHANNYDVSLEYYTKSGGLLSAAVFRKDVTNAFGSRTVTLDQALIKELELDPIYEGWDFVTTFNIGEDTKVEGYELSLSQKLGFLHPLAEGFSVFGNITKIKVDGPSALDRPPTTANWGISYSRKKIGLGLAWNYTGSRVTDTSGIGVGGRTVRLARTTLDLTSEFRITPHWSVFFNARNLTNALRKDIRLSDATPEYSQVRVWNDLGAKMSAGFKGTF